MLVVIKKKQIILFFASLLIIAILIPIIGTLINEFNYNKNVNEIVSLMSTGEMQSLYVFNENSNNWSNIAPDYPKSSAYSPYNFKNTTTDKQYSETYSKLSVNMQTVKNKINYISSAHMPLNTDRYDAMMRVYANYKEVTNLAIVVSGTLMEYQHKFTLANHGFNNLYGQYGKYYNNK